MKARRVALWNSFEALARRRVAALGGFRAKTRPTFEAIAQRATRQAVFAWRSRGLAEAITRISEHPDIVQVAIAGSYRRKESHDLDFLWLQFSRSGDGLLYHPSLVETVVPKDRDLRAPER